MWSEELVLADLLGLRLGGFDAFKDIHGPCAILSGLAAFIE